MPPPRAPRTSEEHRQAQSKYASKWRQRTQEAGGHVTNVSLSPQAWARVQEVRQNSRSNGTTAKAISALLAGSVLIAEDDLERAREILSEYPSMGSIDEVLRVCIGHLLWKIRQDKAYMIAVE